MKVLLDFHHHALAESLIRLFEDRFGCEVYFPIGMDWFDQGVWQFEKLWHGDKVARQYLGGIWHDATEIETGIFERTERRYGRVHRGITLDRARAEDWSLVISSLSDNDDGFHALAKDAGAWFGIQIGNAGQHSNWKLADFALVSATLPFTPSVPHVVMHQEFDMETFRASTWGAANSKIVASFVNCFPEHPSYPDFLRLARSHGALDWRVYGAYGTAPTDEFAAGDIERVEAVADAMRGARVAWHSKHWSDGFGHVIHNWFAIGRPVIGHEEYYRHQLAGPLWVEGETSFDLGRRTAHETVALIDRLVNDDDLWLRVCENAAARFRELVDFDAEAAQVADMLGLAVPA